MLQVAVLSKRVTSFPWFNATFIGDFRAILKAVFKPVGASYLPIVRYEAFRDFVLPSLAKVLVFVIEVF